MRGGMAGSLYRFEFGKKVSLKKVEESLLLAVVVVESLHGRQALRLGTSFQLDKEDRSCAVDGSTEVGRQIACVLTGLLSLEFGEEAFAIVRDRAAPGSRRRPQRGEGGGKSDRVARGVGRAPGRDHPVARCFG